MAPFKKNGRGSKKPVPKWVTMVSGDMDQHLRFAPLFTFESHPCWHPLFLGSPLKSRLGEPPQKSWVRARAPRWTWPNLRDQTAAGGSSRASVSHSFGGNGADMAPAEPPEAKPFDPKPRRRFLNLFILLCFLEGASCYGGFLHRKPRGTTCLLVFFRLRAGGA